MTLPTIALGEIAPAQPLRGKKFPAGANVWQLNLDQIEPNTGVILSKEYTPSERAGSSTYWFDERHVLYSKLRPYLNKVALPDEPGIATTELVPLCPDPERLNRQYLAYYLRSKVFLDWVSQQVAGAKMPRVSMASFWSHEIPVPSLKKQEEVVKILDKASTVKAKRQDVLRLIEQFMLSAFLEIFGPTGKNSKNFSKMHLGNVFKLASGKGLTSSQMASTGPYPVYGGNGITGWHNEYMKADPEIVIGRVGVYCGAVHMTKPYSWITDNALYVKEYKIEIDKDYLLYALKLADINQYAGRAAQPLVSGSRIYPIEILVPPPREQQKFSALKSKLEKLLKSNEIAATYSSNLFNALSHQLFSVQ